MLFDDEMIAPSRKNTNNEWYTPPIYIESARLAMGSIDLDPASSIQANQRVRAGCYYTKDDNGLAHLWFGNVWCNPPYTQEFKGHSSIKPWVEKAIQSYENGSITSAILLIPNDTSTRWFGSLWRYLVCFPSKRIQFDILGKRKREQPTFGTCFVYLGPHEDRFIEIFSRFGHVVKSVSAPRSPAHEQPTLW